MNKLSNSKSGSSFWFIYVLAFVFVITILFIIFSQILKIYIYPTTVSLTNGNTADADRWLGFWDMLPYVIILIGVLFMFFRLTQRETVE